MRRHSALTAQNTAAPGSFARYTSQPPATLSLAHTIDVAERTFGRAQCPPCCCRDAMRAASRLFEAVSIAGSSIHLSRAEEIFPAGLQYVSDRPGRYV